MDSMYLYVIVTRISSLNFTDATTRMHFYFNVSYINQHEKILEGEFHLFKLRPRPPDRIQAQGLPKGIHLIEVLSEPGILACMHVDPVFRLHYSYIHVWNPRMHAC